MSEPRRKDSLDAYHTSTSARGTLRSNLTKHGSCLAGTHTYRSTANAVQVTGATKAVSKSASLTC